MMEHWIDIFFVTLTIYEVIFTVLVTLVLFFFKRKQSCFGAANFWCTNDWKCKQACSTGRYNPCFAQTDGIAKCLYGPKSPLASECRYDESLNRVACDCPETGDGNNCLGNCAANLSGVSPSTVCCCKPGVEGCPHSRVPIECENLNS